MPQFQLKQTKNNVARFSLAGILAFITTVDVAHAAAPNLSGPWQVTKPLQPLRPDDGSPVPLLPQAQSAFQKNQTVVGKPDVDPITRCVPPGVSRLFAQPMPFNIIQGRKLYGFLFQWNHLNRVVYMDTPRFEPIGPSYLGQSIGHLNGSTLVIDTNQYNDTTWLDDAGLPHSDQLETVERIHLAVGGKQLVDEITITDPGTFSHPWTATIRFDKKPGVIVQEDYCLGRTGKVPAKG